MRNKTIFTALLLFCFTICFAMTADPTGRWTGYAESPNGSMEVTYTFKVDGPKLTGTIEGPEGSLDLQNGTYKDSVLAFDLPIMNKLLHQTGKYYGDSITLDFTIRTGPIHLKLLKNK
jgi:hypothetical protein